MFTYKKSAVDTSVHSTCALFLISIIVKLAIVNRLFCIKVYSKSIYTSVNLSYNIIR